MPDDILYRSIRPRECRQVVTVHRATFASNIVARTIFSSPLVDRYLSNLITFPELERDHILWGAWQGDTLAGYAHFQTLPESWHLNYVAVSPDYQGRGIGRKLLALGAGIGRQRGYTRLSLDVERDNQRAMDWYRHLGLHTVATTWFYEKGMERLVSSASTMETIRLLDWESAEACQLAYGFSKFCLTYQEQTWVIGRLSGDYFRVAQRLPVVLEDTLVRIDPTRRLLISSTEPIVNLPLEIGVSFRMQGAMT